MIVWSVTCLCYDTVRGHDSNPTILKTDKRIVKWSSSCAVVIFLCMKPLFGSFLSLHHDPSCSREPVLDSHWLMRSTCQIMTDTWKTSHYICRGILSGFCLFTCWGNSIKHSFILGHMAPRGSSPGIQIYNDIRGWLKSDTWESPDTCLWIDCENFPQ